ncbi:Rieske 2Fe-2S domain-containing protein [Sphingomonas canadensis]|uniref:Rieske 2Fe-2S domain-containing protein n=1 Tax=Sphingomonas canadensis TaxID=1219257 RepID=A0ABW3HB17_9SPHN|nr:Rieske 2Fe-2S domain-containing protein [Sphingomonas canadensis]MCW3837592.1 Rieske 2Fe-2S domain-containing protein [Sphingomonas canadensis]
MLSREDNELLTRIGPGTPMGAMMREYWFPVVRSAKLEAGGAPERVRLLGENFVAFRSPDGSVGFIDEACPHRCASMALARNEEGGLRCIFHGWKVDALGSVTDCPTEPEARREIFAAKVPVRRHHAREMAGMLWVHIGGREVPPPLPDFEWSSLPAEQLQPQRGVIRCNWLQALEATLDSAHVGFLHSRDGALRGTRGQRSESTFMRTHKTPRFEFEVRPYGFREAAIRDLPDGECYTRIREVVLPNYSMIPRLPGHTGVTVISVPIDDEAVIQWYLRFDMDRPIDPQAYLEFGSDSLDPDYFNSDMGDAGNMWHQDREAMKAGHWSGIVGRTNAYEDFIVQESMGPIVDRSREFLGAADVVISLARRQLLQAVKAHREEGIVPFLGREPRLGALRALSATYPQGEDWKRIDAFNPPEMAWAGAE